MRYTRTRPRRLSRREWVDVGVFLGLFFLMGVGLICYILGVAVGETIEGRLSSGGMGLAVGALLGIPGYLQMRYGITLVHDSWWSARMRCVHKSERPVQYRLTTLVFLVGSAASFVGAALCLLGVVA